MTFSRQEEVANKPTAQEDILVFPPKQRYFFTNFLCWVQHFLLSLYYFYRKSMSLSIFDIQSFVTQIVPDVRKKLCLRQLTYFLYIAILHLHVWHAPKLATKLETTVLIHPKSFDSFASQLAQPDVVGSLVAYYQFDFSPLCVFK